MHSPPHRACGRLGACLPASPACPQVQYRPGSPAGYAVLRYKGAEEKLPATPPPQPGSVQPWTFQQAAQVMASPEVVAATKPVRRGRPAAAAHLPPAEALLF